MTMRRDRELGDYLFRFMATCLAVYRSRMRDVGNIFGYLYVVEV